MESDVVVRKQQLRRLLLAARRAVPPEVRAAEAVALAAAVGRFSGTVCAYHPVGSEPGSGVLLDGLLARGVRVLLPVVTGAALDWVVHTGSLRQGPLGLLEPEGALLGAQAIGEASVVLVPALAVDRHGVRLGRGGGHYDRSLPLAGAGVPLVAVVRDDEILPEVPAEPHDVRMTAALTPLNGLRSVPPGRGHLRSGAR